MKSLIKTNVSFNSFIVLANCRNGISIDDLVLDSVYIIRSPDFDRSVARAAILDMIKRKMIEKLDDGKLALTKRGWAEIDNWSQAITHLHDRVYCLFSYKLLESQT